MGELIQARTVVDMIVTKRGCSEGYARRLIIRHRRLGSLKTKNTLRFGTRIAYLYEPNHVSDWIDNLKVNKKIGIDK